MLFYQLFLLFVLLAAAPIIAFSYKPSSESKLLFLRLIFAIILTYILAIKFVFLLVHYESEINQQILASNPLCHNEFASNLDEKCKQLQNTIFNGKNLVGVIFPGLLFVVGYIGLWELIWRKKYNIKSAESITFSKICVFFFYVFWIIYPIIVIMAFFVN